MTDKPENPSAFPVQEDDRLVGEYGMTLRDYFAGQALAGLISMATVDDIATLDTPSEDFAEAAYGQADAMLKERAK